MRRAPTPSQRRLAKQASAHQSWANTVDRTKRTSAPRAKSPGDLSYWIDRLDPTRFADATSEQRQAAASAAMKAYFTQLALKSSAARHRKGAPR